MISFICVLSMSVAMNFTNGQMQASSSTLEETWQLEKMNGNPILVTKKPTLEFLAVTGRVFGNCGCNNYRGNYSVNANHVSFSGLSFTKSNCPDATLDEKFAKILSNTNLTWEVKKGGTQLYLTDGQNTLQFVRTK